MTTATANASTVKSVALTGSTGMVGSALVDRLMGEERSVMRLVRGNADSYQNAALWEVENGMLNPDRLSGVDGVVHLAGENISAGRWNQALKSRIRNSRVNGTRSLVESLSKVENRPRVLVCASAIGIYGDRGNAELTEESLPGTGFLAEVCKAWEDEASKAEDLGVRVVRLRIGVVVSRLGGALRKMLLPFKMGAGGIVGSGKQYWSWIGLNDLVSAIVHCLDHETLSGPVNAVSPNPVTNADFTKALGDVLHRPTILPVPAFAARLALGEMADALLLASARVLPRKLEASGFPFQTPEIHGCLENALSS